MFMQRWNPTMITSRNRHLVLTSLLAFIPYACNGFLVTPRPSSSAANVVCGSTTWRLLPAQVNSGTALHDKRLKKEIEENSRYRAQTGGVGETATGAILGGLLLGPFGALFGASIGSSIGAKNSLDRARKEEMERLGITQEMLHMAEEVGIALERSTEGLKATQDSFETLQRLARRLEEDANDYYERAKKALEELKEEETKKWLMERHKVQEKLRDVLIQCADAKKRYETMQENVRVLEQRAMEVDALFRRSVGAKAVQDSSTLGLSLPVEDPLLKKFKDLGID